MNLNRFNTILIVSALLTISACDELEPEPPVITQVSTQPLGDILVPYQYRASAQALSLRHSDISAEINASVSGIIKDVGDTVADGELLIQLDCREAESIKNQTEATLAALKAREALARQQLKRTQKLRRSKSVSEEELNQKQSSLNAAAAERQAQVASLEIASLNVERCTVRAPFAGVITERFVQQGERITQNTRVLHLVDHENLQIQAQIPAEAADNLTMESKIQFTTNKSSYVAQLLSLAAVIDSRTQTQAARFSFIDKKPKAGTLGYVTWADPKPTLPVSFVVKRKEQQGVFYAENGTAHFYPLNQIEAGQPIYIDLPKNTRIITQGRLGLTINETIQIKN